MVKTKSTNRKRTKKTSRVKKSEINKELLGIITVFFGILSLVSMYSYSTGEIGSLIRNFNMKLAGFGGYFIPYLIMLIGIMFVFNRLQVGEEKRAISIIVMFICFLTIIDINYFSDIKYIDNSLNTDLSFLHNVKLSIKYGEIGESGGALGGIFSFFTLKLFGIIGSYIIISCILIISFLILTNISFVNLMRLLFGKISLILKRTCVVVKDSFTVQNDTSDEKSTKKFTKRSPDKDIEQILKVDYNDISVHENHEIDQKIKILDYTKESNIKEKEKIIPISKISLKKDKSIDEEKINDLNLATGEDFEDYIYPSIELLKGGKKLNSQGNKKDIIIKARKLELTLENFGINAKITQINKGPTITRFELQPAPGVKVSKIVNLSDDIALGLAASDIRIEAPIPGKSAIGIEVPNKSKINVLLREVLETNEYKNIACKVPFALGKDIAGKSIVANIEKMPHLLIAGATGSGKSVCINTLITSILFKARPDEVKLLMIDPKVVELGVYNGIPHLLIPVVTDPRKAAGALNWAIQEMTKRYKLFADNNVRDLTSYNKKAEIKKEFDKLPQIVIIIDELADLMMVSPSEVEDYICRLAQMARAAGIHLIIATQRPSVDVITGTIKANIPSRVAFAVSSQPDSRTILGMGGAEKLLGKGDMLYHPVGASKPMRIQGAFIDEEEVESIVAFLKQQCKASYKDEIVNNIDHETNISSDAGDKLLPEAIDIVVNDQQASISKLQRRLRIGYSRAARLIDEMETRGIVGGHEGSKPRKVLVTKEDLDM